MSDTEIDDIENPNEVESTFSESEDQSPTSDLEDESESFDTEDEDGEEKALTEEEKALTEEEKALTVEVSSPQSKSQIGLPETIIASEQSELVPPSDDLSDDSDDELENLSKFDKEVKNEFLVNFHPESINHNYDEIYIMAKVTRDKNNNIIDDLHRTLPILSKYEKTRVLGQRAKQINTGSRPFISVEDTVIDGLLIAQEELHQKKIPFIIRRPMPSGGSEYWHLSDLEIL